MGHPKLAAILTNGICTVRLRTYHCRKLATTFAHGNAAFAFRLVQCQSVLDHCERKRWKACKLQFRKDKGYTECPTRCAVVGSSPMC